ncbi:MAG: hypothetical protein KatS3mg060_1776 [Dehalococcoidia bacterium]|nr:MAG: hypothetical protein KatS3mg060_1776 [Dehalococcoidia bacterium]
MKEAPSRAATALPHETPRRSVFYGWWVVASGIAIQVFSGSLFGGFGTFIVPLEAEFGWSKTVFAGATGLRQIESGLLGPVQGWLIDRFGSQILVRVGVVLFGLGFVAMSQIDSIVGFYAAFLLAAIGASLGGVQTLTVTVVNWFERRRATALGLLNSGWSIGGLLVPVMALAMSAAGWRTTMLVAGILLIVTGLPLAHLIRSRPEDLGLLPDGAPASCRSCRPSQRQDGAGWVHAAAGAAYLGVLVDRGWSRRCVARRLGGEHLSRVVPNRNVWSRAGGCGGVRDGAERDEPAGTTRWRAPW